LIDTRVNFPTQLVDDFTVDLNASFADELIAGAATSQSGGCEHLVETLWTGAKGPPARWLLFT
jgi:hypothetical protein